MSETRITGDFRFADVDCQLVALTSDDAPEDGKAVEVIVAPDGDVQSDSGPFTIDQSAFDRINERFEKHRVVLPFDYEHQTLGGKYSSPDGTAPLSGEIRSLKYVPKKGIVASVVWTERARKMIRAREYLYPSPVIMKVDGKVVGLHSVGLTNKPAIVGMERLAAKEPMPVVSVHQEKTMELLKEMQKQIGTDTDTAEVLVNKVGELKKKAEGAEASAGTVKAVCKALGVAETASETEVLVAINSAKQSKDAATVMQGELTVIKNKMAERDATDLMQPYLAANKINPNATEDVAICKKLAAENPEAFKRLMAERQPYVTPGRTAPPDGSGKKSGSAKEEELIANALKEHKGDYGDAIEALQLQLKQPYLEQGLTHKAANQACKEAYPKIFTI